MALCGYAHFALGHHWSLIILLIISTTGCPKNALSESSSRSYNQSEPTSLACKLQAASQTPRWVSLQDDDSESAFFWDTLYNTWWNPGQLAVEEHSWAASDRLPITITYHRIYHHPYCVYQHQCHSLDQQSLLWTYHCHWQHHHHHLPVSTDCCLFCLIVQCDHHL